MGLRAFIKKRFRKTTPMPAPIVRYSSLQSINRFTPASSSSSDSSDMLNAMLMTTAISNMQQPPTEPQCATPIESGNGGDFGGAGASASWDSSSSSFTESSGYSSSDYSSSSSSGDYGSSSSSCDSGSSSSYSSND